MPGSRESLSPVDYPLSRSIGAVLGPLVGQLPGQFQLFTGIALAVYGVGSGEDIVIKGLRGSCIVAEFAAGGGLRNLKGVADDLNPPKSLNDWRRSIVRQSNKDSDRNCALCE